MPNGWASSAGYSTSTGAGVTGSPTLTSTRSGCRARAIRAGTVTRTPVVVGDRSGEQVDISRGTPPIEGGEEHAALEDETTPMLRSRQPVQESLEDIEDEQLVGGSAFAPSAGLQVEVGPASRGVPAWTVHA